MSQPPYNQYPNSQGGQYSPQLGQHGAQVPPQSGYPSSPGQYPQQSQYPPQGSQYPPQPGGQFPNPQAGPQGGQFLPGQYPSSPGQYPQQSQYPSQGGQYSPKMGQPPFNPSAPGGQYPPTQGGSYPPQPQGSQYPPSQGQFPPQGQYGAQQTPQFPNPQAKPSQYPPSQGGPQYQPQGANYPPSQYPTTQGQFSPSQGGQYAQGNPQYPSQQGAQSGWGNQFFNQISSQEMSALQNWFASVDTDRSGTISAQELSQLQLGGRPLGLPAAKKLIKVFDKNYSGNIDFYEYASLHQFLIKMQTAFVQSDQDRSGLLDAREIYGALQSAGFQLTLPTVQAICSKFDTTGRGLTLEQFIQVCGHLAAVRSIFEWNDQAKSGKNTFSYDQLAHVTVHLMDI